MEGMNLFDLKKKKYISEREFLATLSYEYWCFRNHPKMLKAPAERRKFDEYIGYLQTKELVIIDWNENSGLKKLLDMTNELRDLLSKN